MKLATRAARHTAETEMLRSIVLAVVILIAIELLVKMAIAPVALKQDGKPSTADLVHPPTPYGTSAVVAAPPEKRH